MLLPRHILQKNSSAALKAVRAAAIARQDYDREPSYRPFRTTGRSRLPRKAQDVCRHVLYRTPNQRSAFETPPQQQRCRSHSFRLFIPGSRLNTERWTPDIVSLAKQYPSPYRWSLLSTIAPLLNSRSYRYPPSIPSDSLEQDTVTRCRPQCTTLPPRGRRRKRQQALLMTNSLIRVPPSIIIPLDIDLVAGVSSSTTPSHAFDHSPRRYHHAGYAGDTRRSSSRKMHFWAAPSIIIPIFINMLAAISGARHAISRCRHHYITTTVAAVSRGYRQQVFTHNAFSDVARYSFTILHLCVLLESPEYRHRLLLPTASYHHLTLCAVPEIPAKALHAYCVFGRRPVLLYHSPSSVLLESRE